VTGLFAADLGGTFGTWVGALATIAVWSYLVGERTVFRLLQLLLAGLATGYLALLAIREVLIPRLIVPLAADPAHNPLLLLALAACLVLGAAAWLPPRLVAPLAGLVVGASAAFALGGAVVGTILPQLGAGLVGRGSGGSGLANGLLALVITILVLVAFLRGGSQGRLTARASAVGRWLLVGGIGAWLGFLVVTRLALLVDRIGFLLGDWLGILR
jgi:hypothetical protein